MGFILKIDPIDNCLSLVKSALTNVRTYYVRRVLVAAFEWMNKLYRSFEIRFLLLNFLLFLLVIAPSVLVATGARLSFEGSVVPSC